MKIIKLTLCALLAAIMCVLSPLSVPFGSIPVSLATLSVYLVACTVNLEISLSALVIYILLGAFGLPVFAGFTGGLQQIFGLTGGYIIGYIPCLIIISIFTSRYKTQKAVYPLSMLAGTCLCYIFGTVWFIIQTSSNIYYAVTVCILPFIFGDILKIAIASIVGFTLRKKLNKLI